LEFVKSYSSHVGPLLNLVSSQPSGDAAASVGWDGVIKFYDVAAFDVSGMIRTGPYNDDGGSGGGGARYRLGRHAALIEREELILVVSTREPSPEERRRQAEQEEEEDRRNNGDDDDDSDDDGGPMPMPAATTAAVPTSKAAPPRRRYAPRGAVLLFSATSLSPEPLRIVALHAAPVSALAYDCNPGHRWIVSADSSGVLELWDPATDSSKSDVVLPYASKMDTDLYVLMKKKTFAIDVAVSNKYVAVYCADRKIRIFSSKTCKLVVTYDERLKVYDKMLANSGGNNNKCFGMDAIEYGKRAALEREMD